jgi:hypothetical protein
MRQSADDGGGDSAGELMGRALAARSRIERDQFLHSGCIYSFTFHFIISGSMHWGQCMVQLGEGMYTYLSIYP